MNHRSKIDNMDTNKKKISNMSTSRFILIINLIWCDVIAVIKSSSSADKIYLTRIFNHT